MDNIEFLSRLFLVSDMRKEVIQKDDIEIIHKNGSVRVYFSAGVYEANTLNECVDKIRKEFSEILMDRFISNGGWLTKPTNEDVNH